MHKSFQDFSAQAAARLSMLLLSAEEERFMENALGSLISFMDEIHGLSPQALPFRAPGQTQQSAALREDEVSESLPLREVLRNAPNTHESLIVIPKWLELEGGQ